MVYILSTEGKPLMPTKRHGHVRYLLKHKQAKVVKRCPFTVQLLYDTTGYTQPITLGVDAGTSHIGMSASTEKQEVYAAEIQCRTDIVKLLKARREMRSARRNRNTRHRAARFDNRVHSKQAGWLAPSIEQKIGTHIKAIQDVCAILPVTKVRVEINEFDIHKLKNPDVHGVDYQYGEKYGHYNTRNYVLWRDGHKCRICGATKGKLFVVSVDGTKTVAPEDLYTVCYDCKHEHETGKLPYIFKRKRHFAPPTQMGIMRDTLLERLRSALSIPVEQTCGYITKGVRDEYFIPKSHINDAYCIAHNMGAKRVDEHYRLRKVRCHNRQLHKCTIPKGGVRKSNQAPRFVFGYQLFDKVRYAGQECFLFGRRASGSFRLATINGATIKDGVLYKKLRHLDGRKNFIIERRQGAPLTTEVTSLRALSIL